MTISRQWSRAALIAVVTACTSSPEPSVGVAFGPPGGWDGTNCMGASYATTVLDRDDVPLVVPTRTAIGCFVDEVALTAGTDASGARVFEARAPRFAAVGLRSWFEKFYQVVLRDGHDVAGADADGELIAGHYDVAELDACALPDGPVLLPAYVRDLIRLFLYALVQDAPCPIAGQEAQFAAVEVVLLERGRPYTLDRLIEQGVVRPVPEGTQPTHPCLLWAMHHDALPMAKIAAPIARVCAYELGRLEAVVTLARDHEERLAPPSVAVPISFAGLDSLEGMEGARDFLRSAPEAMGFVTAVAASESCASPVVPCPQADRVVTIDGFTVEHAPQSAHSPTLVQSSAAAAAELGGWSTWWSAPALAVLLPWGSEPTCLPECPPEVAGLEPAVCE